LFEYDESKSRGNFEKHGIDFVEAQRLWDDLRYVDTEPFLFNGELRQLFIGKIRGKCYTAVITKRDDKIRIISVRRSRKKEVQDYDEQKHR
jgi:uncharacterized DUF497 family protein